MHDIIIVGGGISGLYLAYLLSTKTSKNVMLLEKSNRLGGLIDSRFETFQKGSRQTRKKTQMTKYEAGGAVVYDHQKHMLRLLKELTIETNKLPFDSEGNYLKELREEGRAQPLAKSENKRYIALLKKVFAFMDKKKETYCRQYTLEQICIQVVGFQDTRFLEFCYGYAGEFRVANSVVARKNIENEVFHSKNVVFFKNGYERVIDRLAEAVQDKVTIHLNKEVIHFNEHKDGHYTVNTKDGHYITRQLVFMVPQQVLAKMDRSFHPEEITKLNCVEPISLCRVFHKYNVQKGENKWVEKVKYATVNNALRQVIPANKKKGLLQISYSDWYFADFWGKLNDKQSKKLTQTLVKETYPSAKIKPPTWTKTHFWKGAIHFWKPNCNERSLYNSITHMRKNLFIGGESFSLNQGWCEGAIQTSEKIFKLLE